MGQPPSVVMGWPASDVQLLAAYLAREPAPTERIEYAVAHLHSSYANAHRGDQPSMPLERFLMFAKAWRNADGRYTDDEMDMLDQLDRL